MGESSKFLVHNGESELWMKGLVLQYLQSAPLALWRVHTPALILALEVVDEQTGHAFRAVPYASSTVFPRLELVSQTTTTRIEVPVPVVIKVLSLLHKVVEQDLWVIQASLIGMCNQSVRDLL